MYALLERVVDDTSLPQWLHRERERTIPSILAVDGVVGIWEFASTASWGGDTAALELPTSPQRVTMIYLDQEPALVGARLCPILDRRWDDAPAHAELACPFAAVTAPIPGWGTNEL